MLSGEERKCGSMLQNCVFGRPTEQRWSFCVWEPESQLGASRLWSDQMVVLGVPPLSLWPFHSYHFIICFCSFLPKFSPGQIAQFHENCGWWWGGGMRLSRIRLHDVCLLWGRTLTRIFISVWQPNALDFVLPKPWRTRCCCLYWEQLVTRVLSSCTVCRARADAFIGWEYLHSEWRRIRPAMLGAWFGCLVLARVLSHERGSPGGGKKILYGTGKAQQTGLFTLQPRPTVCREQL